MVLIACSCFDTVAKFYSPPFTVKTVGEAIRGFRDACRDSNSQLGLHPEDYQLMLIGKFDDSTGVFEPVVPEVIERGSKGVDLGNA